MIIYDFFDAEKEEVYQIVSDLSEYYFDLIYTPENELFFNELLPEMNRLLEQTYKKLEEYKITKEEYIRILKLLNTLSIKESLKSLSNNDLIKIINLGLIDVELFFSKMVNESIDIVNLKKDLEKTLNRGKKKIYLRKKYTDQLFPSK